MHLLILGGSMDHLGGVEAFCERSMQALSARHGDDWRMTRLPTSSAYLNFSKLPRYLRGLSSLVRYRFQRPDCVWLQYVNLPDLGYLALARLMGMRVMVTPHLGSNWRSQSNPLLRSLSGWLLGRAGRLALISRTQELEINLPAAVPRSDIRNFLPAELLQEAPLSAPDAPRQLRLIHSGRLSEGKGTFLFVEVCAELKARQVPFAAQITGAADQATNDKLHGLIASKGLTEDIQVRGRVSDSELLESLRASDVLVHLSRIDSYPLIVLEAMTCSMLPVCMELAGARDMIQTYDGYLVSTDAAVREAADFLTSLDIDDARKRAGVVAERVRLDYSWEACAGALERALVRCTKDAGAATAS
jgi:glycosyltransferase involved in cell wall biosynthesis